MAPTPIEIETQKHNLPLLATRDACAGRTYIVTGANVGLGLEAAKHLVALGAAKVVLAVRNLSGGETAKAEIESATGVAPGVAEVWPLDLASYASVKAFAKRAATELERIDGLIENAAVAITNRELAEGHVTAVTVNVLSTFLLAALMLPVMREKAKKTGALPRLVIVTSRVGFREEEIWAKIKHDPLVGMDDEQLETMRTLVFLSSTPGLARWQGSANTRNRYPLSKLTETMAVKHLAGNLLPVDKAGVVVNLVCPGFCVTKLIRNLPPDLHEHLTQQHVLYGRTAEDGSRTLLHGVVAGKETHGLLLHSCEIGEADVPDWANDDKEAQKRAWDVIAAELEAVEPGCVSKMLQ
ncbi:Dehydrogenase/reductase SDR family member 13 [Madurella mycetomatis]|uniref:Dehydrogenase/reductase SDR family member 13 n=1 Tax=Madurella mycetomatis TaxID=100816 RepID=A0A175W481_9PEZI|nr:Dehydrogenase/reductase SDR family member 13 [Madurella mycetomatis]